MCVCRKPGLDIGYLTLTFFKTKLLIEPGGCLFGQANWPACSSHLWPPQPWDSMCVAPLPGFCTLILGDQSQEPHYSANTLLSESCPEVPHEGASSETKQNLKFNSSVTLATVLSLHSHVELMGAILQVTEGKHCPCHRKFYQTVPTQIVHRDGKRHGGEL